MALLIKQVYLTVPKVQKKPLRKEVNSGAGVKVSKRLLVFTGKFSKKKLG